MAETIYLNSLIFFWYILAFPQVRNQVACQPSNVILNDKRRVFSKAIVSIIYQSTCQMLAMTYVCVLLYGIPQLYQYKHIVQQLDLGYTTTTTSTTASAQLGDPLRSAPMKVLGLWTLQKARSSDHIRRYDSTI